MGIADGLLGGLASGALSFLGTQSANQKNWDISQANNEWSAQQYATRYQTTVKDLQAAGLSPMLAYSQGAGTAPVAQQTHPMQNAMGNAVESFNKARTTSSAVQLQAEQAEQARATTDQLKSQVGLTNAQTAKVMADTAVSTEQANLVAQDVAKRKLEQPQVEAATKAYLGQANASAAQAAQAYKTIEQLTENIGKIKEEARRVRQEGDISAPEAEFARKYPKLHLFMNKFLPSASSAAGATAKFVK